MNQSSIQPKKNKISYWNSIFSMTTVLFITGFLAIFIWIAKNTTDILKESVVIQVELVDTSALIYNEYQSELATIPEIKKIKFISKDSAAAKLNKEINEDMINVLGYNPLFNSFEINVKSEFFNPTVLEKINKEILKSTLVKDASYPRFVSKSLDKNLKKVSAFIGAVAILMLILSIILIDSTIKLALFSDRFLIKSMEYVGATKWFIIRPYLARSLFNGIVSALLACIALVIVLILFSRYTEIIDIQNEIKYLILIFFGLILLGIIISTTSTYFAVNKYLKSKIDTLY